MKTFFGVYDNTLHDYLGYQVLSSLLNNPKVAIHKAPHHFDSRNVFLSACIEPSQRLMGDRPTSITSSLGQDGGICSTENADGGAKTISHQQMWVTKLTQANTRPQPSRGDFRVAQIRQRKLCGRFSQESVVSCHT